MDRQPFQSLESGRFPPMGTLASKTDGAWLHPRGTPEMREPSIPGPDVEEAAARLGPTHMWRPPFLPQTCRSPPTPNSTTCAGSSCSGTDWVIDAQM